MISSNEGNMDKEVVKALEENIITALKEIYDPEIPVDIFELGLIYEVFPSESIVYLDITQIHVTQALHASARGRFCNSIL